MAIGLKVVWNSDPKSLHTIIDRAVRKATGDCAQAKIGVGIFCGVGVTLQHLECTAGELNDTNIRMIIGKAEVVRSRLDSSLGASAWLEKNHFTPTREQFAPGGVWLGGAVPVIVDGHMVAIISVTGGDHADFDHPVAQAIASEVEAEIRKELGRASLGLMVERLLD